MRRRGWRTARRGLAEIVPIYGIRNWIEQGYKQVKGELGWADFRVCSDIAPPPGAGQPRVQLLLGRLAESAPARPTASPD
jgi:hypothetical protein